MIISRVILKNWRNFKNVNVSLGNRVFIIGPNASGKSNFLDVFKFLRDIVKQGGGLQKAISDRGGVSKIRCLAARQDPDIGIEVHLSESPGQNPIWKYAIGIKQQGTGRHLPYLGYERVWDSDKLILERPNSSDKKDDKLLSQTHLEQITANNKFRDISTFLESVKYLHLVPQLLRYPNAFSGPGIPEDPFGRNFLERVAKTPEKTRQSRLNKIESALRIAVPQLKNLIETKDEMGIPHLEVTYEHWRAKGAKQREDQFSDGTLRLLGLLWSLLESDSLLLLEEPELSLNREIVRQLPGLIYRLQRQKKRQIILSTHNEDLLSDKGIALQEILILTPSTEGTEIKAASSIPEFIKLLAGGLTVAEVVMPKAVPEQAHQLALVKW
ncbi:MAG: AAA family ATPase [Dehalococcoidia bacterium]|nr:AAA family ATPase [Dehalococcoidia bacterium]